MKNPSILAGAALMLTLGAAQAQPISPIDGIVTPDERGPKWKAGIAAVALTTPDYPGSDEYQTLVRPLPYFVYYGRVLRADDDEGSRLRRRLTPTMELSLSGGGALSSDSSGSEARRGMPDLDYLIELGPKLRLSYDGPRPASKFAIDLPLRGVISVGSGIDWQGFVFAPELSYISERFMHGRLSLRAAIGSDFGSTALQRYYYEVAPKYATPTRPEYSAKSGYIGSYLSGRVAYDFTPRVRGFVSLSYDNHAGAANEDSPLFESENGYSAVMGVSWSFFHSTARAED